MKKGDRLSLEAQGHAARIYRGVVSGRIPEQLVADIWKADCAQRDDAAINGDAERESLFREQAAIRRLVLSWLAEDRVKAAGPGSGFVLYAYEPALVYGRALLNDQMEIPL